MAKKESTNKNFEGALEELEQVVGLLGNTLTRQELVTDIGREVVGLILGYAKPMKHE